MNLLFTVVVILTVLSCIKACTFLDKKCKPSDKIVKISDMRQMRCVQDSSQSLNNDPLPLTFEEDGIRWNCVELSSADTDFERDAKYPAAPAESQDQRKSFSYTRLSSGQIINCLQSGSERDELIFTASKGFFPIVDVKKDVKYLCIHANKEHESLADRVARMFKGTCEEDIWGEENM